MAPVISELRSLGAEPQIIFTGQHTDLLKGTPAETELVDAIDLKLTSSGSIFGWIQQTIRVLYSRDLGDIVVVQGDTMSAFAGASAAARIPKIRLAHIEAGIRSHGPEPWPEEDIRVGISGMADYHFCATETASANLNKELNWPLQGRQWVTGNPVVSALTDTGVQPCAATDPPTILITLHRRELRARADFGAIFDEICFATRQYPKFKFVWPVHPAMAGLVLRRHDAPNLSLIPPLGYIEFLTRLATVEGILTDSGGAVEEAATLGVPTVIFRDWNDRPEAIEAGIARQIRPSEAGAREAIQVLTSRLIPRKPSDAFGDSDAARKIAEILVEL